MEKGLRLMESNIGEPGRLGSGVARGLGSGLMGPIMMASGIWISHMALGLCAGVMGGSILAGLRMGSRRGRGIVSGLMGRGMRGGMRGGRGVDMGN